MEECSICLDIMDKEPEQLLNLSCGHKFHKECLSYITGNKCPLCRTIIDIKRLFNIPGFVKICCNDTYHYNFGYAPYINNGPCRFCFGKPLKSYIL
jgi:hypothetical protein